MIAMTQVSFGRQHVSMVPSKSHGTYDTFYYKNLFHYMSAFVYSRCRDFELTHLHPQYPAKPCCAS